MIMNSVNSLDVSNYTILRNTVALYVPDISTADQAGAIFISGVHFVEVASKKEASRLHEHIQYI
jgi:hypothetical protein